MPGVDILLSSYRRQPATLDKLSEVVENGGNVFAELLNAVEVCSLGQITERLHEVAGVYRPTV